MSSHFMTANSNRRVFMMQVATAASAAMVMREASAQAMVDEKDPQAVGLAYKADATKVDKAKNPKFAAGSNCANCALFQAKAGAVAGACPLFAGKQVAAKAWCSAWAKKA
jgi:High potential iron-sulfur protein